MTIVDLNRKQFAEVLRKLPGRRLRAAPGTHNERGAITLGELLKSTVDHLEHHLKFIHEKRAKHGQRDVVTCSVSMR